MNKPRYDYNKIQSDYDAGHAWETIKQTYGISDGALSKAHKTGKLKFRNKQESMRLARLREPESFRHSEQTKRKLSAIRKRFLIENPDAVPYKRNHASKQSYPEAYFAEVFKQEKLDVSPEYRVGTYRIDFALPNRNIAIEVDGEQHYVDNRIVKHDIKRDLQLSLLGWKTKRIRWAEYQKLNFDEKKKFVKEFIASVTE